MTARRWARLSVLCLVCMLLGRAIAEGTPRMAQVYGVLIILQLYGVW